MPLYALYYLLTKKVNLPTTTEEGGIPGVVLEICGVRRELGVLWEVLLEVTKLGPGAGVRREPPGVWALLELLKDKRDSR